VCSTGGLEHQAVEDECPPMCKMIGGGCVKIYQMWDYTLLGTKCGDSKIPQTEVEEARKSDL